MKGNVYHTVARQAAMHSLETVALTKRLEAELMLRFSLGESRMDKIQVEQFGDKRAKAEKGWICAEDGEWI